jgi:hypothetical protein
MSCLRLHLVELNISGSLPATVKGSTKNRVTFFVGLQVGELLLLYLFVYLQLSYEIFGQIGTFR